MPFLAPGLLPCNQHATPHALLQYRCPLQALAGYRAPLRQQLHPERRLMSLFHAHGQPFPDLHSRHNAEVDIPANNRSTEWQHQGIIPAHEKRREARRPDRRGNRLPPGPVHPGEQPLRVRLHHHHLQPGRGGSETAQPALGHYRCQWPHPGGARGRGGGPAAAPDAGRTVPLYQRHRTGDPGGRHGG